MRGLLTVLLLCVLAGCSPKPTGPPTPRPEVPAEVDPGFTGEPARFALALYAGSAASANELERNPNAHVLPIAFDWCGGGVDSLAPRWVSLKIVPTGETEDHRRRRHLVLAACEIGNLDGPETAERFDQARALLELALSPAGSALTSVKRGA